eukprot:TRINITY_DN613_c0_g1_i1.p7 TRINITY_DN613_c0_g1~~TRINITY_DN613_c0_g1_i1.p7  ORF type:complete len:427 (+),score=32.14 TRINITY_DN613_c0_g1_i1:11411-12691(+)
MKRYRNQWLKAFHGNFGIPRHFTKQQSQYSPRQERKSPGYGQREINPQQQYYVSKLSIIILENLIMDPKASKKVKLAVITDPAHLGLEKFKERNLAEYFDFDVISSKAQAESLSTPTDYMGAFIMTMGYPLSFSEAAQILEILLKSSPKLSWVHTLSAGVDFLTAPALIAAKHVTFTNARGAYNRPLAEFALLAILYFAKKMPFFMKIKQEHKFEKHVNDLAYGATVGIIGYGSIGRTVGKLLKDALNAKIYAITNDPVSEAEKATLEFVGNTESIKEILPKVDYVITILPLTPKTKGLINASLFKLMKPNAIFINIGRGPTVKESDLIDALKNQVIAGAGLDVFEVEPLPPTSPLYDMDNVLMTPHSTDIIGNMLDLSLDVFEKELKAFAEGRPFTNVVNLAQGYQRCEHKCIILMIMARIYIYR